jgi:hypothetical protein
MPACAALALQEVPTMNLGRVEFTKVLTPWILVR